MDRHDFITTGSGLHFTPFCPRAEQVRVGDIAHALSNLCRANGHCCHFYSVAQHSIACALEAGARGLTARVRLACLLHDASEAYLSDITRPVKAHLPEYLAFEEALQNVIFAALGPGGLDAPERALVAQIDDALLWHEFDALMPERLGGDAPALSGAPDFSLREAPAVEREFLALYEALSAELPDALKPAGEA